MTYSKLCQEESSLFSAKCLSLVGFRFEGLFFFVSAVTFLTPYPGLEALSVIEAICRAKEYGQVCVFAPLYCMSCS